MKVRGIPTVHTLEINQFDRKQDRNKFEDASLGFGGALKKHDR
jgi:hypothetical protein